MITRIFTLAGFLLAIHGTLLAQMDTALFRGIKPRSIGPAGMSGRISEVTAVESNPSIMYVGSATGGVWKSTSGGTTWEPIFDDQPVASIGAVAVHQENPSIVWVGTGEGNPRNSSSVGNGIFRSLDGGATWKKCGLDGTEKIHRVILHPHDERVVYVAALGPTWGESSHRGVYRTTDGGISWSKVLYVNERTGCADLVMDPVNPNKLFAAMWEHRRWPWTFSSGGPGSGLYVTYDGGNTWSRCVDKTGLPEGEYGRIGVAVCRSKPDVVYALVEAERSALCRSDDGGRSWSIVNTEIDVTPRPFYFADIRIDPLNENRIYRLTTSISVSEDGGKSFRRISFRVHPDHHSLWIHPHNPDLLIDGNDGGVAISYDRGQTWRFVENLPLGQFYHINVDNAVPYNIYGGMQDNGSWKGPSDVWEPGGIRSYHWKNVGGGDGFAVLADPLDEEIVFSMSQGGNLARLNMRNGERRNIRPDAPDSIRLRFNWNAAIATDPLDPATLYYGSQYLHRSSDRGDSWRIVSPDLTTDDSTKQKQRESGGLTPDVTAAENHCSIVTISPSPVRQGVIWVGTDDGNIQLTTDGGKTWSNLTARIPGLPAATWCPHIEASKFKEGAAFIVFDDHRRNNWKTYIFKTEDFGRTWKNLARNRPYNVRETEPWGYALVIEQDPVKEDLLYLGTEFGLFISFDDGEQWMKWRSGYPTVSTMALHVHPRDHDLVIGTHGRSAYILDDVRPFRELNPENLAKPLHLFPISPAIQRYARPGGGYGGTGNGMFRGEAKPYGAMLTFLCQPHMLPSDKKDTTDIPENNSVQSPRERRRVARGPRILIEIFDSSDNLVRRTETEVDTGLNRWAWNLRSDGYRSPRSARRSSRDTLKGDGPPVLPGSYRVRLKSGMQVAEQRVEVREDPEMRIPVDARKSKLVILQGIGKRYEYLAECRERIEAVGKSIEFLLNHLRDSTSAEHKRIRKNARMLKKRLDSLLNQMTAPPNRKGIRGEDWRVMDKLQAASAAMNSSYDAPTATHRQFLRQADDAIGRFRSGFDTIFSRDVAILKQELITIRLDIIPDYEALTVDW